MKDHTPTSPAILIGPLAALATAGSLSSVRDDVGRANVALLLGLIVCAAAWAGRAPGVVTALVAAISFNFFHARPFYSVRITDRADGITVCLLVAVGLGMSSVSAWRRREHGVAKLHVQGEAVLEGLIAQLAEARPTAEIWDAVRRALEIELRVADCAYRPGPPRLATVARNGGLPAGDLRWTERGFELPQGGVALPVTFGDHVFGHIELVPASGAGSIRFERRVAVAVADLYGICLSRDQVANLPR